MKICFRKNYKKKVASFIIPIVNFEKINKYKVHTKKQYN